MNMTLTLKVILPCNKITWFLLPTPTGTYLTNEAKGAENF